MAASPELLHGFAYGEHLDSLTQRSLGFRLLCPAEPQPWTGEVETLARRLQTAPYPEHWPATDLFCSVLLADGKRVIALARYGLVDHTPSQRRGGLELLGVTGPSGLSVVEALAIYQWIRKRRQENDSPQALEGSFAISEALAAGPVRPSANDPVPVLPIRLWQEGALLFAATGPGDPDHNLRLLEQNSGGTWQWLPLIGGDFPLLTYAQRGSTIAWTPHLAGVAVKLEHKPPAGTAVSPAESRIPFSAVRTFLTLAIVLLLALNLGAVLVLVHGLYPGGVSGVFNPEEAKAAVTASNQSPVGPNPEDVRAEFAEALFDVVSEQGQRNQWIQMEPRLVQRYERVVRTHPSLRLKENNSKGRAAVGAVSVLAGRNADRLEEVVRQALFNRGFSDKLIKAACDHVREEFSAEPVDYP
ncbi:MAG: hypothetical protein ACJ8FY_27930 [Gemmataceae bacterium]